MKTKRIPKLRRGADDTEVARWAKKHDVFDRLDSGVAEAIENHSDLDRILKTALVKGKRQGSTNHVIVWGLVSCIPKGSEDQRGDRVGADENPAPTARLLLEDAQQQ